MQSKAICSGWPRLHGLFPFPTVSGEGCATNPVDGVYSRTVESCAFSGLFLFRMWKFRALVPFSELVSHLPLGLARPALMRQPIPQLRFSKRANLKTIARFVDSR